MDTKLDALARPRLSPAGELRPLIYGTIGGASAARKPGLIRSQSMQYCPLTSQDRFGVCPSKRNTAFNAGAFGATARFQSFL